MLNKQIDESTHDLRDPMLSALLREAFADDPALADAPGRTDRIMRSVLASGVRPVRSGFRWAPFAWATGAVAMAAAVVVVVLGLTPFTINHPAAPLSANATPHTHSPIVVANTPPITSSTIPNVEEKPQPSWMRQPGTSVASPSYNAVTQPQRLEHNTASTRVRPPAPVTAENSTTVVAASLYEAGRAADAAGDHETAYNAYQASYTVSPTPDALLASSQALEDMSQQELALDASSS